MAWWVPAVWLALKAGEVAWPLASVITVAAAWPPAKLALAPWVAKAKRTDTPDSG